MFVCVWENNKWKKKYNDTKNISLCRNMLATDNDRDTQSIRWKKKNFVVDQIHTGNYHKPMLPTQPTLRFFYERWNKFSPTRQDESRLYGNISFNRISISIHISASSKCYFRTISFSHASDELMAIRFTRKCFACVWVQLCSLFSRFWNETTVCGSHTHMLHLYACHRQIYADVDVCA